MEAEGFTGDGRFEIQRRLGEGGFGTVYAAFDREFGMPVALKRLRLRTPEALYRFKKEFRSLAGVIHPNLVSLYELFQVAQDLYFTMELVQGRHLFEHLRPGQPVGPGDETVLARPHSSGPPERRVPLALPDLDNLRAIFGQLARALHALHGAGLLHRDIKSSNVLVTGEGRVVVLDFGLVTASHPDDEGDGMVVGTPHYMSPEQWVGGIVAEPSDWYSFGVVLYEALTGIAPFEGTVTDLALNKLKGEPLAPRALDPRIPEELDALCRQLLRVDPWTRPTGPEIIRALGGPGAGEATEEQAPRAFVGRAREMSSLLDAFQTAVGGRATTVHLHGDSGIGKTALFEHFSSVVGETHRAVVLRGRSYAQESLPFKALDGAMDELSRLLAAKSARELAAILPDDADDLACLFPTLRRVGALKHAADSAGADERPALEVRRHAAAVLRQLLARMTTERPLIIYLDDVHWGDVDSVGLIHDLMQQPDAPAILLILAYRDDDEASPFLRELSAREVVSGPRRDEQRIFLGRITAEDCEDLAAALLQRRPVKPGALTRIAREAGGNPLFVEELVRYARAGGSDATPRDHDDTLDTEERNVLLNGVVQRRIGELPPQWQRLVEVLGVAAQPVDVDVARQAAGLDSIDGTMLNRLRAGHLVRTRYLDGREQIAPYHDRIREIVVTGLAARDRQLLHGAIAEALVKSNRARPGVIANHLRQAGELDRAADYAYQAGEEAARALAFEDAADLYGKVLEWKRGDSANARRLLRKHADALANAGRCADAAPRYLEAAGGADATEALDLKRLACEQYLMGGMTDDGMRILEELCRSVDVSCPKSPTRAVLALAGDLFRIKLRGLKFHERHWREIPRAQLVRIDICISAGRNLLLRDPMLASRFNARALRLALDAGEPNRIVEGLASMGTGLAMQNIRDGHKMLARAREIAERVGTPTMRGLLLLWSAFVEHGTGHWISSLTAWDEAVALLARASGVTSEKQKAQLNGILAVQLLGRFDELRRRTERAMTEARATGNRYTEVYARLYSAIPLLAAGDAQACRARIADALARGPEGDHYVRITALKFECYCDLYEGRALDGLRRVEQAWPEIASSQMLRVAAFRVAIYTLRAGLALQARAEAPGREAALIQLAEADARRLAKEGYAYALGQAALLQAGISAARGDRAAAVAHAGEALHAFESAGVEMELAYARRWLGLLSDNDEGAALVAGADAFLRSRAVADPARFTASHAPGLLPPAAKDVHHVAS
ncbi:MAG: hypothetical protein JWN44_2537 [Myxococcales bacterium]|nr:hypothetical protein [Myxococcales bacterium]